YSIEDVEGSDLAMLVEVDPGAAAVMESVRAEGSWEGEIDAARPPQGRGPVPGVVEHQCREQRRRRGIQLHCPYCGRYRAQPGRNQVAQTGEPECHPQQCQSADSEGTGAGGSVRKDLPVDRVSQRHRPRVDRSDARHRNANGGSKQEPPFFAQDR
ncbi:MAG: hypothetical protein WCC36_05320, partial [Gammaproteobacteria bacterium]